MESIFLTFHRLLTNENNQQPTTTKPNMSLIFKSSSFYNSNHLNSIRSLNYCRSIRKQIRKHLLDLSKKHKNSKYIRVLFYHEHKCWLLLFVILIVGEFNGVYLNFTSNKTHTHTKKNKKFTKT